MKNTTSTRERHNYVRYNDDENYEGSDNDGVELNPFIGSVLGVAFLPFDSRLTTVASSSQSSSLSSDDENGGKQSSQKDLPSTEIHDTIQNQLNNMSTQQGKTSFLRNLLKTVQTESQKTVSRLKKSADRVDRLDKTLTELELKYDLAMRTLVKENGLFEENKRIIGRLDIIRKCVEDEMGGLDVEDGRGGDGGGVGDVSFENDIAHGSMFRINDLLTRTDDDDDDSDLNDYRALVNDVDDSEDDLSFASALETNSDMGLLSLSGGNHDDDEMLATTAHCSEDSVPPLTDLPSLLRIHDVDLPKEKTNLSSRSSNHTEPSTTRSDLYSLNQTDRFLVLHALLQRGLAVATDEGTRWIPDWSTSKHAAVEHAEPCMPSPWHFPQLGQDPMVWSGSLDDKPGYGDDVPAVKGRAVLFARPYDVLTLLMDNDKVKEYNNMSLGRTDKYMFEKDDNIGTGLGDTAVTKTRVIQTLTNVAILRRRFELLQILHVEPLDEQGCGMKGWIVVTRSLWETEGDVPPTTNNTLGDNDGFIRSEMLMSVNIIREVLVDEESGCIVFGKEGDGKKVMTELTTMTHFQAPGMPSFGAKQFALKTASNFICKIRDQFPASDYKEEVPISSCTLDDNDDTMEDNVN